MPCCRTHHEIEVNVSLENSIATKPLKHSSVLDMKPLKVLLLAQLQRINMYGSRRESKIILINFAHLSVTLVISKESLHSTCLSE